jgi:hypothetical protein
MLQRMDKIEVSLRNIGQGNLNNFSLEKSKLGSPLRLFKGFTAADKY